MSTLADDLLLVLLDADTGRPKVERTMFDYALSGAVLLHLALDHRVDIPPGPSRRARVVVLDPGSTGDDVLDDALHRIETTPARADKLVPALSKGLRARLLGRAERQHLVHHEEDRVLRLFRRDRWPAGDARTRSRLVARLSDVLLRGTTSDPRTSALIALLAAIDAAHVVVDARGRADRAAVRRRAREIGAGAWAADAVRKAVEAVQAAVAASTTGAVVAATTAST